MSQIAKKKFPRTMLLGGLSVNLNHLKTSDTSLSLQKSKNFKCVCEKHLVHNTFYTLMFKNLGPDEGSAIPIDVINHGDNFGLKGVNYWLQLSHRQVVDAVDSLKKRFKQDYDRVNKIYIKFIFLFIFPLSHPLTKLTIPFL